MDDTLRDTLAVEVREDVDEVEVLEEQRAVGTEALGGVGLLYRLSLRSGENSRRHRVCKGWSDQSVLVLSCNLRLSHSPAPHHGLLLAGGSAVATAGRPPCTTTGRSAMYPALLGATERPQSPLSSASTPPLLKISSDDAL
jgi:hypothetical protein